MAAEKTKMFSINIEPWNLDPKKLLTKKCDRGMAKADSASIIIEIMIVSVKSYWRFCFFLLAFLGRRTVKMERDAKANIWDILDAREKIPTSANPPDIFAAALLNVGQLSAISWETPAG